VADLLLSELLHDMMIGSSEEHTKGDAQMQNLRAGMMQEFAFAPRQGVGDVSKVLDGVSAADDSSARVEEAEGGGGAGGSALGEPRKSIDCETLFQLPDFLTLDDVCTWDFDPDRCSHSELARVAAVMMEQTGVLQQFSISSDVLGSFLLAINKGCPP
jgi:hypothetical protein